MSKNENSKQDSNRSLTLRLLVIVVVMFGFGVFALPPMYDAFCEITGFGGQDHSAMVSDRSLQIAVVPVEGELVAPSSHHELADLDLFEDVVARKEFIGSFAGEDDQKNAADTIAAVSLDDQAPVVQLVQRIVSQALRDRASDIHIEPFEDQLKVRYRVDGPLRVVVNCHCSQCRRTSGHHVAATAATGKAVPEILCQIDDEGLWVISVVYGTGADEALTALFQGSDPPLALSTCSM